MMQRLSSELLSLSLGQARSIAGLRVYYYSLRPLFRLQPVRLTQLFCPPPDVCRRRTIEVDALWQRFGHARRSNSSPTNMRNTFL